MTTAKQQANPNLAIVGSAHTDNRTTAVDNPLSPLATPAGTPKLEPAETTRVPLSTKARPCRNCP